MAIVAVIFDLGGVVLGSPLHAFAAYEKELGLAHNFLNHLVKDRAPTGAWSRLERGELSMADFGVAFEAEAAQEGAKISASTLMERVATESRPRPVMLEAIATIRQRGLKVAALTNNWASDEQQSKMDSLRSRFDVFIESAVVGLRKPDPAIYELACERLAVHPSEAVFLDDIGGNLKPARAMGMTTIKVIDPAQALGDLGRALGVEF